MTDIDPIAVERLTRGDIDPATVRPAERRAAIEQLTAQGLSIRQITQLTGMDRRVVERFRAGRTT